MKDCVWFADRVSTEEVSRYSQNVARRICRRPLVAEEAAQQAIVNILQSDRERGAWIRRDVIAWKGFIATVIRHTYRPSTERIEPVDPGDLTRVEDASTDVVKEALENESHDRFERRVASELDGGDRLEFGPCPVCAVNVRWHEHDCRFGAESRRAVAAALRASAGARVAGIDWERFVGEVREQLRRQFVASGIVPMSADAEAKRVSRDRYHTGWILLQFTTSLGAEAPRGMVLATCLFARNAFEICITDHGGRGPMADAARQVLALIDQMLGTAPEDQ